MADERLTTEEWTKLFNVLSHDLKSPLFSIDGFSDLLLSDYSEKIDDEGLDFLRRIRSSAAQMRKILDEMSTVVKTLGRPVQRSTIPVREILEEVCLKLSGFYEEQGVRLNLPEQTPSINADPEMMREAVTALLRNAASFNDRNAGEKVVDVTATSENGAVRICVKDNGIGIDERYQKQIFDPGIKLDKSRGGGPGYGLFFAKRVAELHGGRIETESVPGEGSTFCLVVG